MTVSLIGDGIFLVAMAWQAYELWNAPAALSLLGIGMTVPTIAFLLPAGVAQRPARPPLDHARARTSGARVVVGVLAASRSPARSTFWQLVVLVALYGVGTAFFMPAFEAIVPTSLPRADLAAGQLARSVRPADRVPPCRARARRWLVACARHRARLRGRRRVLRGVGRRRPVMRPPRHAPRALSSRRSTPR